MTGLADLVGHPSAAGTTRTTSWVPEFEIFERYRDEVVPARRALLPRRWPAARRHRPNNSRCLPDATSRHGRGRGGPPLPRLTRSSPSLNNRVRRAAGDPQVRCSGDAASRDAGTAWRPVPDGLIRLAKYPGLDVDLIDPIAVRESGPAVGSPNRRLQPPPSCCVVHPARPWPPRRAINSGSMHKLFVDRFLGETPDILQGDFTNVVAAHHAVRREWLHPVGACATAAVSTRRASTRSRLARLTSPARSTTSRSSRRGLRA